MKVLLFTGAGASVELGVPAMKDMARDLYSYFGRREWPANILERLNELIQESDFDLEHLIELVDTVEKGEQGRKQLGVDYDEQLFGAVRTMRWETEWYVQHSCERIRDADAFALWGSTLRRVDGHEFCIVTTNYDRAIESTCEVENIPYDDGFASFDEKEYAMWAGTDSSSPVKLLKIHGSTDWYQGVNGETYKLRHPMPLYGELRVSARNGVLPELASAMVLPTKEKKINHPPYPDLVTDFRNAGRSAEVAFFVGTSLRDPDILDIFRQCSARIPTYLVSRRRVDADNTGDLVNRTIVNTASGFLISTLPKFLKTEDFGLLETKASSSKGAAFSVLPWLSTATGRTNTVDRVCEAIDRLVDAEVSIDGFVLGNLLSHSEEDISKYALALIPHSVDREAALECARKKADVGDKTEFRSEYEMLMKVMEASDLGPGCASEG